MAFFQDSRLRYSASDNPLKPNRLRFFLMAEADPKDRMDFEFNPTQITDPNSVKLESTNSYQEKELIVYKQVKEIEDKTLSFTLFMNEIGSNHLHPYMSLTARVQWLLDKLWPKKDSSLPSEAHVLLAGIPLIRPSRHGRKLLRVILTEVTPTYTWWDEHGWPQRATVAIKLQQVYLPAV